MKTKSPFGPMVTVNVVAFACLEKPKSQTAVATVSKTRREKIFIAAFRPKKFSELIP